jgi:hypothetical protein
VPLPANRDNQSGKPTTKGDNQSVNPTTKGDNQSVIPDPDPQHWYKASHQVTLLTKYGTKPVGLLVTVQAHHITPKQNYTYDY